MSLLHKRLLSSRRWAVTRRLALDRGNWRCERCWRSGRLEVHHRVPLAVNPAQDPYNLVGLVVLCRTCHFKETALQNRRHLGPQAVGWRDLVGETI